MDAHCASKLKMILSYLRGWLLLCLFKDVVIYSCVYLLRQCLRRRNGWNLERKNENGSRRSISIIVCILFWNIDMHRVWFSANGMVMGEMNI